MSPVRALLLCCLAASLFLLPVPQTAAAAPEPPGRAFAAPSGPATAWVTPGPQPELWVAGGGSAAPQLAMRGASQHYGRPVWSPDGRQVAVLVSPTGTQTLKLSRWWLVDTGGDRAARAVDELPAWAPNVGWQGSDEAATLPETTPGGMPWPGKGLDPDAGPASPGFLRGWVGPGPGIRSPIRISSAGSEPSTGSS